MAAKRLHECSDDNNEPSETKKIRPTLASYASFLFALWIAFELFFCSCIKNVTMMSSNKNVINALEPILRRVVKEEVESALHRAMNKLSRSPSFTIEPTGLQLSFANRLSLPIFTGSKIVDINGSNLQVVIVGDSRVPVPLSMKVEIMVLNGDFPLNNKQWTRAEFDRAIVKEREGKRPLLAGDSLILTLRDGVTVIGDIEFTDNSSWIRSRRFCLAARVCPDSCKGLFIREAITETFVVKDHRGELYKKHYPPKLNDKVWRLEKIGKDGAFDRKLATSNVNTVQDFLKLSTVDQSKLRLIMGCGMSEKMWETTIKHAKTCDLGNKLYIYKSSPNCTVTLNPICQIVEATINDINYSSHQLSLLDRRYIEDLVTQAYNAWNSLEEVTIGIQSEKVALVHGIEFLGDVDAEFQCIVPDNLF